MKNGLTSSGPSEFYVVGGTMRPNAASYVRRNADEELFSGLLANEFCHVLTARQMGKSSLMLRTALRLRDSGISVAALDLTGIGTNLTAEQWYSGLIIQLGDRLDIEDELLDFWQANVLLGPMQRWVTAIRKVVLPLHSGRLAIFIDEIDAVASLTFSTDEFFAGIRECYNLRNEDEQMNRLTFCLLGVVNPADLIRDTRTTPFNVGRRVELNDFTEQEAASLASGLGRSSGANHALLRRVLYWTNGHPYLTQRLCKVISEGQNGCKAKDIDNQIEEMYISKRAQEYDDNLLFVRERLLRSDADVASLLNLYSRVRRNKRVSNDASHPLLGILQLSGITRVEYGRLRVRNRIYERVFNGSWVKINLPDAEVKRQRAAFRRGVIRTTAVAAVLLIIVTSLALYAFWQGNLARAQTAENRRLLYSARMKLAFQEHANANIARVDELVSLTAPQPGEDDLRGFEWFLAWRYSHNDVFRLNDPGHPIASAKFVRGSETIALATVAHQMFNQDRRYLIRFYDRGSGSLSRSFEAPGGTHFDVATFSQDDHWLATDSPDDSVTLWDLVSPQKPKIFPGTGKLVRCVVFSPDQQLLAASVVNGFQVWDRISGILKFGNSSNLEQPGIAFSPDGKRLLVGTDQNVAAILDANTGGPLQTISYPKGPLGPVFFSPDGNTAIATTLEGLIYGFNLKSQQLFPFKSSHSNEIFSYAFSPDGKTLATGSLDRTVKLWDANSGTEKQTILGHGGWVGAVNFSADGQYLISGDNDGLLKMWDLSVKELPVWPETKAKSIAAATFAPNDTLIAIGQTGDDDLMLWDLSSGQTQYSLGKVKTITSAAFSDDASLMAVNDSSQIKIYSVSDGRLIRTLAISGRETYSLDFSPDNKTILSADSQGNVILSDVTSGQFEARLNSGNMYYRAVYSPDGKKIASADQDGKIRIWDAVTRTIERTLSGASGTARSIAFSPDSQLLATASQDNTLRLWTIADGKERTKPVTSDSVERLTFSPDGKRLIVVSLDRTVVIRDVRDLTEVVTLRQQGNTPSSVGFSSDGLKLFVSDKSGRVTVWSAAKP
jgi:WD40 repeat protein